ncbi:DUF4062 domain-containing protein [Blautia sp. HCP3S3_C12]|uniref:DUF4062 domain-containing protein n=1 Tax=unclassified Blautia TaxID=2648079 RepID=UPI003F8BEA8A
MEKKYQVFVSSTYEDLKSERQAAISCLLDMNCIPVGMEQFPASSLSQWEYIKKMINMSDYYLLIVAGKYGSIDPTENISYTEKEYKYAVANNIPIIAFLVSDIGNLVASKVGKTDEERENVERFRNDVKNAGRLVDFYSDENELKYKIAMAIPKIINDAPRSGWVRADQAEKAIKIAGDESGFIEIQKQIDNLQTVILEKVEQTRMTWEPISDADIDAMFRDDENKIVIPKLSDEAKKLLEEAINDPAGQILVISSLEGTEIQTNGIVMNSDKIGKGLSIWKAAVDELAHNALIIVVGNSGEIYQLSKKGYDVAENILKD